MGILDQLDPQTQGLLSAAFAGLQASGPSRMPTSLGQIIGGAGQAGMASYGQAQASAADLALKKAQLEKITAENALKSQLLSGGGDLTAADPDKLEALALRYDAAGLPGGTGILSMANRKRVQSKDAADIKAMQSKPATEVALNNTVDADGNAADSIKVPGRGGILGAMVDSPYVGGMAKTIQEQIDAGAFKTAEDAHKQVDRVFTAHQSASERDAQRQLTAFNAEQNRIDRELARAQTDDRIRELHADSIANQRSMAALVASLRNPQIVQTASGIGTLGPGNKLVPITGEDGKPVMPAATARMDLSGERQLQNRFAGASKNAINGLQSVAAYRDFRATGDTAQAVNLATSELLAASRAPSGRFKGKAEQLLGSGYGGGSLYDRLGNFLSQETAGTPKAETLKKLDGLINAAEDANLEGLANNARFYAGMAKGNKYSLQHVTGQPFVQGAKVVFPDGTFATFKDQAAANAASAKWLEANP